MIQACPLKTLRSVQMLFHMRQLMLRATKKLTMWDLKQTSVVALFYNKYNVFWTSWGRFMYLRVGSIVVKHLSFVLLKFKTQRSLMINNYSILFQRIERSRKGTEQLCFHTFVHMEMHISRLIWNLASCQRTWVQQVLSQLLLTNGMAT